MLFRVFFSIPVTLSFQLVRSIEHLTIAATASAYPLKASAQTSLALALAHTRNIPAAADACQAALLLDPHSESAASLRLLLISVLQSTEETMEVADSLKLQLPGSVILHSVIAGLEVRQLASLDELHFVYTFCPAGSVWTQREVHLFMFSFEAPVSSKSISSIC
jgi:hypothetical protein